MRMGKARLNKIEFKKHIHHKYFYIGASAYILALFFMAFVLDSPLNIFAGVYKIVTFQDVLITDYFQIAGPGAAFFNSAAVSLISLVILFVYKDEVNGYSVVELGLMSGFAFFGKNILNIWPIIIGAFLYSKSKKEPFSRYVPIALMATSLSPVVSFLSLSDGWGNPIAGILVGVILGFVLPALSGYTYKLQGGLNLYNVGFACGLLALIVVPIMSSLGLSPESAMYWSHEYKLPIGLFLYTLCAVLIISAFKSGGNSTLAGYKKILSTSGRSPSDFIMMYGVPSTLLNMGVNGVIATTFILVIGGDLNGPVMGAILTVIAFSTSGKHAFNITPVMGGVYLGALIFRWSITDPAVQLASLFCTTMAPISGYFGWPYGVLAGFLHSAVVLLAGSPVGGINLYNNGFSGGLIVIVLYPIITAIARSKRPAVKEDEYYEVFEKDID